MIAIIGAIGMLGASALTAWATASGRISDVDKRVTAVTITEELHYKEVEKRLDKMSLILEAAPWNKTTLK